MTTDRKFPYYTPLRYPGGKGKLSNFVKLLCKSNCPNNGHYIEVYAGGAGVAMELLLENHVDRISINDVDPAVYNFWKSVTEDTDELCKLITDTPVTIDIWREQREVLRDLNNHSSIAIGFATFFLNRCNRSGILKGGVIGGQSQQGKWKLDVRFNKTELLRRIEAIAEKRDRIKVHNLDALELLNLLKPTIDENTLIYLDPPYYLKGKGLYRNFYSHEDHEAVKKYLAGLKTVKWLVSYDNVDPINKLYFGYRTQTYSLSYTAQNKFKGSEILIYSDVMEVPSVKNPSKLKCA